MELLSYTLDVVGKIMIAFTAISVHHRFWKERKIDEQIFKEMRREQIIGIAGIILIVLGYLLRLPQLL